MPCVARAVVVGSFIATDQDGNTFTTTTDDAGRIATVTRVIAHPEIDPFAFTTITASYTYDAAGRLTRVDHGNGTAVVRQYDAADRPTLIRHEDAGGNAMLELAYTYSADGLVTRIVETDEVSESGSFTPPGQPVPPIISQVDFEYDNRSRLTREMRDTVNNVVDIDLGTARYDLSYTYDAGGNRLTKSNGLTGRVTTYVYDIETLNTIDGDQHNNRLLGYDVTDTDPATGTPIAVEQTLYQYGAAGNVVKLVKRVDTTGDGLIDQADEFAAVWWFYYDTSNKLWLAVQGTGMFDEAAGTLLDTIFEKAAEYRYDGGRQRYLVRQRDATNNFAIIGTGQWRDYMGDNIYNDYTVDASTGTVSSGTGQLPGIGFDDPSLANSASYYGSDLIGTTRRVSDSSAGTSPVVHRSVLTAFGEPISTAGTGNTRYGYAGAWGYETPEQSFDPLTELGWQHVGARYYDSAVGRFMQRDPIGIQGGFNTYEYVNSRPLENVDPQGLDGHDTGTIRIIYRDERSSGKTHKEATRFIANANGWALVSGCGGAILLSPETAAGLAAARKVRARLHVDPAHHTFPIIGRSPHIQLTIWLKGIKGSHVNVRIPIPQDLYDKLK